jgi:hypothetical protein
MDPPRNGWVFVYQFLYIRERSKNNERGFNLLETIKQAFAEYEEKMKSLANCLDAEAYHLQQVAIHCNQVSEECLIVGDSIAKMES